MEILIGIYLALSLGITVKYSLEQMELNDSWSIRDPGESRISATKKLLYITAFGGVMIGSVLIKESASNLSKSLKRSSTK